MTAARSARDGPEEHERPSTKVGAVKTYDPKNLITTSGYFLR